MGGETLERDEGGSIEFSGTNWIPLSEIIFLLTYHVLFVSGLQVPLSGIMTVEGVMFQLGEAHQQGHGGKKVIYNQGYV